MEMTAAQAAGMTRMERAGHWVRLIDPNGGATGDTSLVPAADYERYIAKGFKAMGGKPAETKIETPVPGVTTRASGGRKVG